MGFDEQEYTQSFDIRSWKKLAPFLRPYRGLIAAVIALNVVCAVIDIALPLFQRYAIDAFIETAMCPACRALHFCTAASSRCRRWRSSCSRGARCASRCSSAAT